MIAKEFPDRVATMFATLEAFFGLGLIFGPSIGGILYQAGGYTLPFVVLGSILICVACVTFFVLPGMLIALLQRRINLLQIVYFIHLRANQKAARKKMQSL